MSASQGKRGNSCNPCCICNGYTARERQQRKGTSQDYDTSKPAFNWDEIT
jgi:hypothetical protein